MVLGFLIFRQVSALSGSGESGTLFGTAIGKGQVMSITASEARKALFPLIKKVNENHEAIEIVSKHGNAVLVSAEDYAALREGSYLLRSPANARRLLKAYENALANINVSERDLIDPDSPDAAREGAA
jgi:antitoxin YefM